MCLADLRYSRKNVVISSAPASTDNPSSFVVDPSLTVPRMGGYISQVLCGSMCYTFSSKPRIYNHATRQLVTLPAVKSSIIPPGRETKKIAYYYFGHDPVNDQYKVICSIAPNLTTNPEHWVYVLKPGGGSWKKAAPTTPADFCRPFHPVRRGLSINGVIYYLAWIDMYNYVLVSFEVISEEFKMRQVPRRRDVGDDQLHGFKKTLGLEPSYSRFTHVSLIEYGEKVTVFDSTHLRDKGLVELWVLGDTGYNEWSKKTLVLQPSQLHLVNNPNIIFKVNGTTQNGKLVLIPHDLLSPFHILCYDLQRNDLIKIEIKGIPDNWFCKHKDNRCFDVMFMDQSESVIDLLGHLN